MPGKANRVRAGRNNNERRGGQRGNARGKPDKQLSKKRHREQQSRVREAKAKREADEARLAELGGDGETPGAMYQRERREREARERAEAIELAERRRQEQAAQEAEARRQRAIEQRKRILLADPTSQGTEWSLLQARKMLTEGYLLTTVIERTCWGAAWFRDLPLDDEGRGLPTDEWQNPGRPPVAATMDRRKP